jgi:dipeptidyl aminopeptidase
MDRLGYTEVLDQVAAAREVAKRRYVDRARIGIWGWVSLLYTRLFRAKK